MKVLIKGKIGLLESGGGDRVQIENTARELRLLGVEVDISSRIKEDCSEYDLVHVFQLDWTPEVYLHAINAKKYKKPLVLSPIHHSVEEVKKFDDEYVFDFRRVASIFFKNQFKRDTLKNVYKSLLDLRKAYPTVLSVIIGLQNMQRRALKMADAVLVQTDLEAQDLKLTYDVSIHTKKVINGVGEQFYNLSAIDEDDNLLDFNDYIICVGRIEARKNQIHIIEAVKKIRKDTGKDLKLVFLGRKSTLKHFEYIKRFDALVEENDWINYISEVPYKDIPKYLKFAKVGVSASWFETTGLTSLEALFCGANAVASGPRAKEYLGDYVSYCEPDNIESIAKAILKEYNAPRPKNIPEFMLDYTWENAAKETLDVYNAVLEGKPIETIQNKDDEVNELSEDEIEIEEIS